MANVAVKQFLYNAVQNWPSLGIPQAVKHGQ